VIAELEEINFKTSSAGFDSSNKILTLKDREEWWAYLKKLPASMQDAYYTPEYYELYEKNGDGTGLCYVYEDRNGLALYPFLLSRTNKFGYKLESDYFDIFGAYGYNGVLYTCDNSGFIKNFYYEFNNFCELSNIIAEFTRFNPLLKNHNFSSDFLDISYNRKTVCVDLKQNYESIYKNYSRSAKGNIKKAVKNNLTVVAYKNEFPYKMDFIQMYKETMDRVNAQSYVYFNDTYFENSFDNLPVVHFVVFKESIPIASAICLLSKKVIHVHFEVSKTEYQIYRPNNFLFNEIIKFGISEGLEIIHLGGGRSCKQDDSLLRFKMNFSKTTSEFYIGNRIHNQEIYNMVCEQWGIKYPGLVHKYNDKFLKYRFVN
jgi:hypothetical protein